MCNHFGANFSSTQSMFSTLTIENIDYMALKLINYSFSTVAKQISTLCLNAILKSQTMTNKELRASNFIFNDDIRYRIRKTNK